MRKRIPVGRIILGLIIIGGVLPLVAVAPGLGLVFKRFGLENRLRNKGYVTTAVSRLKQQGYIVLDGKGLTARLRITPAGKRHFEVRRALLLKRPKKRSWDGYWRIVMFDIPERSRGIRDSLRRELIEAGFKKLQGSVWISPDECEEYLTLLKADQKIGKRLVYLKTKDIEYGSSLRALFKISQNY